MAEGGPVYAAGGAYVVGERGPEAFVPNQNGTIVPNSQITMNNFYGPVYQGADPGGTAGIEKVMR